MKSAKLSVRLALVPFALAANACFAYEWPSSGTATIPAGTVALVETDADVSSVEGLSAIVLEAADSVVVYANPSSELSLSASVSGAGVFKAQSAKKLIILGDNSALSGYFELNDTPVEVRHRYGLGSATSAPAKYDRQDNGSLDFYGSGGTIQNDVALILASSTKNVPLPVHNLSPDTLVQNANVSYTHWQGVYFGNCDIISGDIDFSTCRISAKSGCTLRLLGTSRLYNQVKWSNYGGEGNLYLGVTGNRYTEFEISEWSGAVICGVDNVFGPTVPVTIGNGNNDERLFYLDIGATTQEVSYVANKPPSNSSHYSIARGSGKLVFKGSSTKSAAVKYRGEMSLVYSGTGEYTLENQLSDATGLLAVESGIFAIASNAGWSGPVSVSGGRLVMSSARSMQSGTERLEVLGGILEIASGVELKVASASIGGVELSIGRTYTVAELNEAAGQILVEGEGVVTVVEYQEPDPEGPFEWPDEEGATAIVRQNETVFVYDEDVSRVAKLGAIKLRAGSTLIVSNLTQALELKANIEGLGKVVVKDSVKLAISGDNSAISGGSFDFFNSVVEVHSRYGLGGPMTAACKFDRGSKGTLNFYSPAGVITNDVMIDVFTSVLTAQNVFLHTESDDTLVQRGDLRFNGYQALLLGNVVMVGGSLSSAGARQYGADEGREFHIAESARIEGADMGVSGYGKTYLDVAGHSPTTYKMSQYSGHLVLGAEGLFGSNVALTLGNFVSLGCGDVDMNGYDATVKWIVNNSNDKVVAGADQYAVVKSEEKARLTVVPPSGVSETGAVKFEGAIDLSYEGEGSYTIINAISTSTGALTVCSGSLTFASGAGWGGRKVAVSGGALNFASPDSVIGSKARLEVTGGVLDVSVDVELEVASALFASQEIPEGAYTAAEINELAGSALMSGGGTIKVGLSQEVFAWPDAPGGAVVVPPGTVGYLDDADIAKVANAAKISIKKGATLHVRNSRSPVSIAAAISGSGSIVVDNSAGVTFSGDNSARAGYMYVTNSNVAVTHRYGLGSESTPEATFVNTGLGAYTLDFYGDAPVNDVPLRFLGYGIQTKAPAVLEQRNNMYNLSALVSSRTTFGNVNVTKGALSGIGCGFFVNVAKDSVFAVCGAAYVNTWTWNLGVGGEGQFLFGETTGTHHYGTFVVDDQATLKMGLENALQAPSENGVNLVPADAPALGYDLNGFSQTLPGLIAEPNGGKYARIGSAEPALLTVTAKTSRKLAVSFEGALSLTMAGSGAMELVKRVSPTLGTLTVASGTVTLGEGAGWLGDVTVSGGTFSVASTAARRPFGLKRNTRTTLTVSGEGAVDLADGVEACVNGLVVRGVEYSENGYYGSAAAAAAKRIPSGNVLEGFTGLGVVRMVGSRAGLAIVVR